MNDINLRATALSLAIDVKVEPEHLLPLASDIYEWLKAAEDDEKKTSNVTTLQPVN